MHKSTAFNTELFHIIKSGELNGLSEFLSSQKGQIDNLNNFRNLLNQLDPNSHQSALHLAASKLCYESVRILLEYGANPDVKDDKGQTPALIVVRRLQECSCEICTRKTVRCINFLGDHNADFGVPDNAGNVPLYLAAMIQSKDCATTLLRNGAPLDVRSELCRHHFGGRHKSMLTVLSEKLPSIVLDVFDRAVTIEGNNGIHDPDCEVSFDLSVILPIKVMESYQNGKENISENKIRPLSELKDTENKNGNGVSTETESNKKYKPQREMGYLNDLLKSRHSDTKTERAILRHPLVTVFTDVKWKTLELIFIGFVFMQIVVLLAYTTFLFITIFADCPYNLYRKVAKGTIGTSEVNLKFTGPRLPSAEKLCEIRLASKVISGYVLMCTSAVVLKEIQHAIMDFKEYVTDLLNYVQMLGLGSIILTIVIAWDSTSPIYDWLYPVASFGIAISWGQIFVQVGRFPVLAIYVDMFAKTAVNFCWSLLIYSFILMGFAMSYCVLFPHKPTFVDIPLALVKVLTMMVGELDYEGLFMQKNDDDDHGEGGATPFGVNNSTHDKNERHDFAVAYPISAHLWYSAFVIMITLVLMNLLVGLAVNDIQGCRKDAEAVVMKRRIRYTTYLEKSSYFLTHFLPTFVKDYLRRKIAIIKPTNESTFYCFQFHRLNLKNCRLIVRPNDPDYGILSHESKEAIRHWLIHRQTPRTKKQCKFQFTENEDGLEDTSLIRKGSGLGEKERTIVVSEESGTSPVVDRLLGSADFKMKAQELSIKRMERQLAELDHKLDMILEATLTRSESPD